MAITVTNTPPPTVAKAVQVEIWLDQNGFPGGFENATVAGVVSAAVAAAEAANPGSGAGIEIRLRRGQLFYSDDALLVAAAPSLGITDLRTTIAAAALL